MAWPQAALDYYPFIDKKLKLARGIIPEQIGAEHADIIKRGVETRMDIYKLGFVILQIVALAWLMIKV